MKVMLVTVALGLPALFAQAVVPDTPWWMNLGMLGVLAWYLYYQTKHAGPRERKDFREEMAASRTHYEEVIDKVVANQRDSVASIGESVEILATNVGELRDHCRGQHDEDG